MLTRTIMIDLGDRERKEAAAARRFPVSVSSETPVPRVMFGERWTEILSHAPDAIDLTRAPLPFLEGHDTRRTNVGIVTGLKVSGGKLRGELVLGNSQRAQELAADIADGIVSGLSVGYSINVEARDEKKRTITATRWTPYEVSVTPIPADTTVGINRSQTMDETTTTETAETTLPTPEAAERQRAADIVQIVEIAKLPTSFARTLLTTDAMTVERAREMVLNELARRSDQIHTDQHIAITAGEDFAEDFHRAAIDALQIRAGIPVAKPHAAARDVSASVYDLARTCLSRAGKPGSRAFGGESRGPDLIKRAMTTSDFPLILAGSLHASIRAGYENEPATHRAWVRAVPVADYRDQARPILGSAPALQKVNEGGEYKDGSLTEDSTSYRVAKYGRIVSLSWETLVNDNLGAFLRVQPGLGQAARRLEADVVYGLLAENAYAGPTMQDGTALFDATHGNLVTPGATLSAAALALARRLLRKMTALGGGFMGLAPRYLLVSPYNEADAELILANASRRTTTEKTTAEWIGSLELIVEPRLLDVSPWPVYIAADSAQIDTVEMGVLEENVGGPVIEEEKGFRVDQMSWKVRHVIGAKVLDWRGLVKLPTA